MDTTSFTDGKGSTWQLAIGVSTARRMKAELAVDIDKLEEGQVFNEIATSRMKLAGCLWLCCEAQADREQIDEQQFAERLTSDCLDAAVVALVGAMINFTPQSKRQAVRLIWEKMTEGWARGTETMETWATENAQTINSQIDQTVTNGLEKAFGGRSPS